MAVALSVQDTVGAHTGSPASPVNYTGLTVASGDTDLVIWLSFGNSSGGAPTTISVVWDSGGTNQSMTAVTTLITSIDGTCTVAMFRLANPTSGNKTARVTWTTGGVINDLYVTGASFTGGGAISGATTNHSTTVSETISVTSGTTSIALSSFACNQVAYSAPATTGTSICVNVSGGTSQLDAIRRVGLGGATAMVPGGAGTSHDWVAMGVSIDPGVTSSTGSASGTGAATGAGTSLGSISSASGTGTATGTGASLAAATGSTAGIGTINGVGAANVTDNFNRANGALGPNWSAGPSFIAPTIISNACAGISGAPGSWQVAYWNSATFSNNQYAGCTLVSGTYVGVFVRHQASTSSGYMLLCQIGTGIGQIHRVDSGAFTQISGTSTFTANAGDTIGLAVTGSALIASVNGVVNSALNVSDSTYATGQPGISVYDVATSDNWFAGPIAQLAYLSPDADNVDGGWTNESGGTVLYSSIDEHLVPNDADYIISGNNPSSDLCRVSLSNPSVVVLQPFNISYRYGKIGPARIDITVTLKQGSTTIASWTHTDVPA